MADQGRVRNITDLAKLAGVSPGTVSRALADSQLIAKKTRERIQQLAREHDFRPNVMARNLRIRRTGAIAVMMPLGHQTGPEASDTVYMDMLGHLADALTDRGHDLLLSRVIPDDSNWLNRVVDSGRVDGVIAIAGPDQLAAIDNVASRHQPLVAWNALTLRHDLPAVATALVDLLFRRIAGEETGSAASEPEIAVLQSS
jgi:DNA-binding LacI/PurR family transcriptional regulator